jgi:hypothetical protein
LKNLEIMESLQLEFELACADDDKLLPFWADIADQVTHMQSFKKTWMKFALTMQKILKVN